MAHPRIFVSSTYYDLKHLRSSLENFIDSLGFEAILSEKGDIAYSPDTPLDESCYREVRNADIFVIIIGGRYGSEKSGGEKNLQKQFFDRYDSITKQEYKSAVALDIPIYILIEKTVYADFENYLRNKDNRTFTYAHVDSVNIFHLIEEILGQPRNNPVQQFDRYADIEAWLKDQWSGLFRELLNRMSSQQQIASLASQVTELAEINKTLKTYLEEVVSKISPKESAQLIGAESKRLQEAMDLAKLQEESLIRYIHQNGNIPLETIYDAVVHCDSAEDFIKRLVNQTDEARFKAELSNWLKPDIVGLLRRDLNKTRDRLNLSSLPLEPRKRKTAVKKNKVSKKSVKKGKK